MDLNTERVQVCASRSIAAPAAKIFQVLARPANHPALDASDQVRAVRGKPVLSGVGDTFAMEMYVSALGPYVMLNRIIAFEQDRRIAWEPTPGDERASQNAGLPIGTAQGFFWSFQLEPDGAQTVVTQVFDCTGASQKIRDIAGDGQNWIPFMQQTLDRLAAMVEQP